MNAARSVAVALVAALAVAAPDLAHACPMCMAGQGGGTGRAFAIGSLFLSVLPLAAIGAAVWYLRRRARALRDAELER
jgi:glycerol-3-phosphate acyltransferase PlsY